MRVCLAGPFPDTARRTRGSARKGRTMGRWKKYRSDKALREAAEGYFASISRVRQVMEERRTGELDKFGHFVVEWVPVLDGRGEVITEREFVLPPTVGGLCAHLGISRDTWAKYCDKSINPQFAETAEWAREQLLSWREKELMSRPGKDVRGLIFDLQVNYGIGGRDASAPSGQREDDPLTSSMREVLRNGVL